MDEETVLPGEVSTDPVSESTTAPDETEAAATGDGSVTEEDNEISETMAELPSEELVLEDGTEATEETVSVVTAEVLQAVGSDIIHTNLFGSFLICGTLVGIVLWRKANGT